jgi:hypothetical protein
MNPNLIRYGYPLLVDLLKLNVLQPPQDFPPSASPSAGLNFSMFQNLGTIDEESRDELTDYLAAPRVKTDDPMKWWWEHRREYPVLHRLALDYLSVPCEFSLTLYFISVEINHHIQPLLLPSSVSSRTDAVCCSSPATACPQPHSAACFVWDLGDAVTCFGQTT